jgi:penicillin-binding protein 2
VAEPTGPDSSRLRLTVILVVVICMFAALFSRLWFLQVINAPTAQATAQDQGVKIIYTQAPRGDILDATGQVLAGNRLSEVIQVTDRFAALTDVTMQTRLGALLGMTVKQVYAAINNTNTSPSYAPATIVTDASPSEILYVQEHQSLFPGVAATTETVRDYTPMGVAAANILGYTGLITATEYKQLKPNGYQLGDQIGQSGIESEYDRVLRGTPGVEKVQVDAEGNPLGVLSQTPPIPGQDIKLTINGTWQETAVSAIEQGLDAARKTIDVNVTHNYFTAPAGSAIVENPQNGDVEVMATVPDYDNNAFIGGISQAQYDAYSTNANKPLLDRAIQGEYAPGSTFKLVTATAGLEEGLITPTSSYYDTGSIKLGGETFTNDDGESFGNIDVTQALAVSSDNFFNTIGEDQWDGFEQGKLSPEAEQKVAEAYGFGSVTGIKEPGESPGEIPTPASVAEDYKKYPKLFATGSWVTGDSMQVAIGQFEDLVTPLQLANAYSAFANGGTLYTPQLVSQSQNSDGTIEHVYPPIKKGDAPPLTTAARAAMLQGFEEAVNGAPGTVAPDTSAGGTAYGIFDPGPLANMDIAGKTGTAQATGQQSTSVFTSFAPASNPQYEVTAFMEKSGYGASVAGPVVRQIYDQIYGLKLQPVVSVATSAGQT